MLNPPLWLDYIQKSNTFYKLCWHTFRKSLRNKGYVGSQHKGRLILRLLDDLILSSSILTNFFKKVTFWYGYQIMALRLP